ncbi:universal stress protein [Mycolicibacterium parafortuitum]|uniref:Universal stress protein family protein [Mycobacterium tuberculosis H37Rv] n=1 Tax=Mycolicibacterium parafortuitum TaxID=39692 RepID=A0A375YGY9_MYCPF|nr:universal stress protein [Mycolicibacterium parafortuitum]ORB28751.1 universal stress protein [Mycolicibacterium parafortuitum]SRX80405.1 Universal stress protein family protein [Mycobacterium tuberculosis H37Rv] [Mycolicibacterium parafortuitum]
MSETATDIGVLVAVDGSPESDAAVRWAAREAVLRNRPVTLIHVVAPVVVTWPIDGVMTDFYDWQEDNARTVVAAAEKMLTAAAEGHTLPAVNVEIRHDGIVPELTAASEHADLLVLGSRGLGRIGGALLGSVSRTLLHHARCPVVVTKEVVTEESGAGKQHDTLPVVLGIDGSPASENATAFAFSEASFRGVDLIALHAWSDVAVFPALGMDWRQYEEQGHEILAERLAGWQERYPDVHVQRRLVSDKPARWLIEESANAQLVVVGSRGRGGISSMLLGSVSTAVAESALAPVAVLRG